MKNKYTATFLLLLTSMIWGFAFVAQIKGSDAGVGTLTFNAIRYLIGAISLIIPVVLSERFNKNKYKKRDTFVLSCLAGTVLFLASTLQQYGASITQNPGLSGFITTLYTVFTPVSYFLIFKKKTGINVYFAIVLSLVGLYMLCLGDNGEINFGFGELYLLLGAVLWTAHIMIIDRCVSYVNPLTFSFLQFSTSAVLSTLGALIFERDIFLLENVLEAKWSILYCGILSVGVAYTLQTFGQKYSEPTVAAIVLSTESVFSAIGGVLWNFLSSEEYHVNQNITFTGYIGCAIIFSGVIISQLPQDIFKHKHFLNRKE